MISVFTPIDDVSLLERTWLSLKSQTEQDFEWILVPYGRCQYLTDTVIADPRVRVFAAPQLHRRGALKSFAVQHASHEILLQLEAGDQLMEPALATVKQSLNVRKPQQFFSDFAVCDATYNPMTYAADYGWETYQTWHDGRRVTAHKAFNVSPVSLNWLPFAPNQCWPGPS